MGVSKIVLLVISILLILTVLLPLVKKDFWLFRIFDYPRMQKFIIILVLCFCWGCIFPSDASWLDYAIFISLLICLTHLGFLIYPFTPLGKKMIGKVKKQKDAQTLDILVSNVFQDNRDYGRLLKLIKDRNPDIVFLLETDQRWLNGLEKLRTDFPYFIEVPQENTYGLLFYSKLPIKNEQVNYLIDDEVPSIAADIEFGPNTVKIFGLHPTPPVPQENDHSTARDAEILLVGKMAKKEKGPCVVIGDLNDVAWSYTTELFLKTSGLLDPRHGRGRFSTFHAKYPLFRWPLDHYFVSRHFGLISIKVEKNIGSDHFPISISLMISEKPDKKPMHADAEDKQLADSKIEAGLDDNPK